jgi:hypothetical protein
VIRDTKYIRFGPVRQEAGSKHLRQGDLNEAINVRQTAKAGVYGKRRGVSRTVQTFVNGSLRGIVAGTVTGQDGALLMRDSGGQLWERISGSNQWTLSGRARQAWVESSSVLPRNYTAPKPFSCLVGTNLWVFALASTNAYDLTIVDTVGGTTVQQRVSVAATAIIHGTAVYDGTNVWVFWTDNASNGRVYSHKFVVATPTVAPTAATYYQAPAAPVDVAAVKFQMVEALYLTSPALVFVCAVGGVVSGGTYKRAAMHSILDPATGLAVVAGDRAAALSVAYTGASGSYAMGGLSIHVGQDGSAATWYYVIQGVTDTDYTTLKLVQVEVSAAVFATFTRRTIDTITPVPASPSLYGTAALCSGAYQAIMATCYGASTIHFGTAQPTYQSRLFHVSGATVTGSLISNEDSLWVASGFAYVNSKWLLLMGFDDFGIAQTLFGSESLSYQRTLFVVSVTVGASATASPIAIEGKHASGNGPALWHRNAAGITYGGTFNPLVAKTPAAHVVGNKMFTVAAVKSPVTGFVDVAAVSVDAAKVYGQDAMMGDSRGITPGGIPMVWGGGEVAHEIAPLIAPPWHVASGGGVAMFNICAFVYAIRSPDGKVWRSAPLVSTVAINSAASLGVPVPYLKNTTASICVEFYLGTTSPKLQAVVETSASTGPSAVSYTCPATTAGLIDGEVLYTFGNALSQAWPVSAQAVGVWKNRVFLANEKSLWFSKEVEEGIGPIFNEVQVALWSESESGITAMAPIDSNYFAVFSQNGIGVLSGPGPDGVGNGNYVFQTLAARESVAEGSPAAQGPSGCYFKDRSTGRLHCVQPSLAVAECAGGAYDYTEYVITSIAWHAAEKQLVFFAAASRAAIVLDYNHPDEAAPFGKVYLWAFDASLGAYGSAVDVTGLLFVDSAGSIYRPANAKWTDTTPTGDVSYQMKTTTAELQFADIQGGFNVEALQVLLTMRGASGVTIEVFPGYAATAAHTAALDLPAPAVSGAPESIATRPADCYRQQSIRVSLTEKAGVTTQSYEFEGLGVEYTAQGRLRRPGETRII